MNEVVSTYWILAAIVGWAILAGVALWVFIQKLEDYQENKNQERRERLRAQTRSENIKLIIERTPHSLSVISEKLDALNQKMEKRKGGR